MALGFIIITIVSAIFVLIGISSWKSEQEVGFFTFTKPAKMKDVTKYNHAVARLWFCFAAIWEIMGIPFLFAEQNSAVFAIITLLALPLVIGFIFTYLKIEEKYRER